MKLAVIFTVIAVAAARAPLDGYEPVQVGPAIVDFAPEQAIGSVDKETIVALLRQLLERISSVWPRPNSVDTFDLESYSIDLDAIREWLRATYEKCWSDGIERPPSFPTDALESLRQWGIYVLDVVWPEGLHRPSELPVVTPAGIRDFFYRTINRVWPHGVTRPTLPDSVDALWELVQNLWPNGFPLPPRPPAGTGDAIIDWVLIIIRRAWKDGIPRPSGPPTEPLKALEQWVFDLINVIRDPLECSLRPDASTVEAERNLIRAILEKLGSRGLSFPAPPTSDSVEELTEWTHEVVNEIWLAQPSTSELSSVGDLRDWIIEVIQLLESATESASPVDIASSPLV